MQEYEVRVETPFMLTSACEYLATVRNKRVIDSEDIRGHYLPVISMVFGKGGRDDLGARMF
jgi:hypothetical protein